MDLSKQWRSSEEIDEYAKAMEKGRGEILRLPARDKSEKKRCSFFNPWVYLMLTCLGNIAYISAIGGYVSASLSTIERRFQLKSSESGAITIINDVVGMLAVLFVTHFGHSRHRPRIVGTAFAMVGIGTIMCALPHFFYDPPAAMLQKMSGVRYTNDTQTSGSSSTRAAQDTCKLGGGDGLHLNSSETADEEVCGVDETATSGSLIWQIGWILAGQVLCGFGTCAQPLCITYLDDNVKNKRTTTIFIGIIFSTFAFGPTLGFMLATTCLARPTNFYDSSANPPVVSQGHPYWIGAWWLGFLINGALLIFVSVPFFFFPKSLRRGEDDEEAIDISVNPQEEVDVVGAMSSLQSRRDRDASTPGVMAFIKDFFQTIKRILTNVTAMSVFFAICAELTGHVGWFVFGPKFMYTQFGLPPAKSSMLFGMMMLPGPIIGNLLSGAIVRKFKLDSTGCAKMVLMLYSVLLVLSPTLYWLGCENPSTAGLTTPYSPNSAMSVPFDGSGKPLFSTVLPSFVEKVDYPDDLTTSCNAECGCAPDFVPVCGSDGITYATACHAGCKEYATVELGEVNTTLFVDCSCIHPVGDNSTINFGYEETLNGYAFFGKCAWMCEKLYYFLGMMLVGSLLSSMMHNPSFMLQFRSHKEEDRSTALGVSNVLMKLVAFIPGPIYFGAIIEKTCLLFQESCGKTGNCLVYDIKTFRLVFTLFAVCGRVIAFVLFVVAFMSVRKKKVTFEGFMAVHPVSSKYATKMKTTSTEYKYTTV